MKIFYAGFGYYPRLVPGNDSVQIINGGIPQRVVSNADLWRKHIAAIDSTLDRHVPEDWEGFGVLDYEQWSPLWGSKPKRWSVYYLHDDYRNESIKYARELNPKLNRFALKDSARVQFERSARKFLLDTLLYVKEKRPLVEWGYYRFPGRLNAWHDVDSIVENQNDQLSWLFDASDVLYPSIYLLYKSEGEDGKGNASLEVNATYIRRTLAEAKNRAGGKPVLAYTWYRYHPRGSANEFGGQFLTMDDARLQFVYPFSLGVDGIVIWGGSADRNGANRDSVESYFSKTIGPLLIANRARLSGPDE